MTVDPKYFKYSKYHQVSTGSPTGKLVDLSDNLANYGLAVSFKHMPSGEEVFFKAFLTTFNETYQSDWSEDAVFGRADPLYMFKQTTRKISIAFTIPAAGLGEAYENLAKVQTLCQFLYPMYTDIQSATTLAQSPLLRMKFANLIRKADATVPTNTQSPSKTLSSYSSGNNASNGLLGILTSVTINHNLDNPDHGALWSSELGAGAGSAVVLPRNIELSLEYSPIHEHTVGWTHDEKGDTTFAAPQFPYGAQQSGIKEPAQTAADASGTPADASDDLDAGAGDVTTPAETAAATAAEPAATTAAVANAGAASPVSDALSSAGDGVPDDAAASGGSSLKQVGARIWDKLRGDSGD